MTLSGLQINKSSIGKKLSDGCTDKAVKRFVKIANQMILASDKELTKMLKN